MEDELDSFGYMNPEIVPVIIDLCDVEGNDEFSAIEESIGLDGAVAYVLAINSLKSLGLCQDDDHTAQVLRFAFSQLSSEGQAKFAETGF